MQEQLEINHSDIPIRLFKSDFLEFFTHVHPITIIVIWVPYSIYMLYSGYAMSSPRSTPEGLVLSFVVGFLIWTFMEYNIHRFFFHFHPRAAWQERIVFLFHGVHHAQPRMKTRLVMPPAVSIPMGVVFWLLFSAVVGQGLGLPQDVGPMVSGFTIGYLIYDSDALRDPPLRHALGLPEISQAPPHAAPLQNPRSALRGQLTVLGLGLWNAAKGLSFCEG